MKSFKPTLLILTLAIWPCFASRAAALPIVLDTAQHTDRFRPILDNPTLPAGDYLLVYAHIATTDPPGSPSVNVSAKQGDTMLTLERRTQVPNEYHGFIDFDSNLTGPWEIVVTDSTGTGASAFTNALFEPEFLPFAESLAPQGSPLGTSLAWTLPNLTGFDVDAVHIRIVQVAPRNVVFSSDLLPPQFTSLDLSPGLLQYGVEYAYNVSLIDYSGVDIENRSVVQSQPFRYALPGDFDLDGDVDGRDFLAWQRGESPNPLSAGDLSTWEAHYAAGSSLNASVGIPEPAAWALLAVAVATSLSRYRK